MKPEEREFIRKNIKELVDQTIVGVGLVSRLQQMDLLSQEDKETLEILTTRSAKSSMFYDIMITKANSFDALVSALQEAKQSGAYNVLMKFDRKAVSCTSTPAKTSPSPIQANVAARDASTLEVGTKECKIATIVTTINDNKQSHVFLKNLKDLGRYLEIESKTRSKILCSQENDIDKLEELLETWKLEQSSEATMAVLFAAIKKTCNADDIIYDLRKKFGCTWDCQS